MKAPEAVDKVVVVLLRLPLGVTYCNLLTAHLRHQTDLCVLRLIMCPVILRIRLRKKWSSTSHPKFRRHPLWCQQTLALMESMHWAHRLQHNCFIQHISSHNIKGTCAHIRGWDQETSLMLESLEKKKVSELMQQNLIGHAFLPHQNLVHTSPTMHLNCPYGPVSSMLHL